MHFRTSVYLGSVKELSVDRNIAIMKNIPCFLYILNIFDERQYFYPTFMSTLVFIYPGYMSKAVVVFQTDLL